MAKDEYLPSNLEKLIEGDGYIIPSLAAKRLLVWANESKKGVSEDDFQLYFDEKKSKYLNKISFTKAMIVGFDYEIYEIVIIKFKPEFIEITLVFTISGLFLRTSIIEKIVEDLKKLKYYKKLNVTISNRNDDDSNGDLAIQFFVNKKMPHEHINRIGGYIPQIARAYESKYFTELMSIVSRHF